MRLVLSCLFLLGTGWGLWNYLSYRGCPHICVLSTVKPPIRLASGHTLSVVGYRREEERVFIDYLSEADRRSMPALCTEARDVWSNVRDTARVGLASVVTLGPTSAKTELLGEFRWYVSSSLWMLFATYLAVDKTEVVSGASAHAHLSKKAAQNQDDADERRRARRHGRVVARRCARRLEAPLVSLFWC